MAWYKGDMRLTDDELRLIIENEVDYYFDEDSVEEMMNECWESITICGVCFTPGEIVKNCDPDLWQCVVSKEKDYRISDMMEEINRFVPDDGETLFSFLNAEENYRSAFSEIIWEGEEEDE